jgi:hypothetical protein
MTSKKISRWLATSLLLSLASLLVTAAFNKMGTQSGFDSESKKADWEHFRQEYPSKDIYTMDELNARSAEIRRIQDKYIYEGNEYLRDTSYGHLFFRDTAINALKINLCIWLVIPVFLGYPVRSVLTIGLFPVAFSAVGLFYAFETAAFIASYLLGAIFGACWTMFWKRNLKS